MLFNRFYCIKTQRFKKNIMENIVSTAGKGFIKNKFQLKRQETNKKVG